MKDKILLTSVGSRVGQALLECLAARRPSLCLLGSNSIAEAPNLYACDRAWLLPETAQADAFEARLGQLLAEERPQLVLASRDADLAPLARLSLRPEYAATRFLVPPPELVPVFCDKYESWRFAGRHGLPFAATAYTAAEAEALLERTGLPLIAKPRWDGHASKDVYLVETRRQLEALLGEQRFVIQELLNPATLCLNSDARLGRPWIQAISDAKYIAELVIGRTGEPVSLSSCSMSGSELGNQGWQVLQGEAAEAVERVALAYARHLGRAGLRGPLNLQGKLREDGSFAVFELNARFTGSVSARAALGYNQVLHALDHYLGQAGAQPPHRPGPWHSALKTPQLYAGLTQADIASLRATGRWQAASAAVLQP